MPIAWSRRDLVRHAAHRPKAIDNPQKRLWTSVHQPLASVKVVRKLHQVCRCAPASANLATGSEMPVTLTDARTPQPKCVFPLNLYSLSTSRPGNFAVRGACTFDISL